MSTPDLSYQAAQAYAASYTQAESPLLAQVNHETQAHIPMPRMLSGHLQGRVLATLAQMIQPARILEIGTYTGYSAICLAEGLKEGGVLHTIDNNGTLAARVRGYFDQAGITHQVQYHIGQALSIIPQLDEEFDLVFIDADKKNYSNYYDAVFDKVRLGGFIIADNVLWSGKVLTATNQPVDKRTQAMISFNNKVHQDPRVAHVLFPIRDGLMVLRKK